MRSYIFLLSVIAGLYANTVALQARTALDALEELGDRAIIAHKNLLVESKDPLAASYDYNSDNPLYTYVYDTVKLLTTGNYRQPNNPRLIKVAGNYAGLRKRPANLQERKRMISVIAQLAEISLADGLDAFIIKQLNESKEYFRNTNKSPFAAPPQERKRGKVHTEVVFSIYTHIQDVFRTFRSSSDSSRDYLSVSDWRTSLKKYVDARKSLSTNGKFKTDKIQLLNFIDTSLEEKNAKLLEEKGTNLTPASITDNKFIEFVQKLGPAPGPLQIVIKMLDTTSALRFRRLAKSVSPLIKPQSFSSLDISEKSFGRLCNLSFYTSLKELSLFEGKGNGTEVLREFRYWPDKLQENELQHLTILHTVTKLELSSCEKLSLEGLKTLCNPNLRSLALTNKTAGYLGTDYFKVLSGLSNLTHLNLSGSIFHKDAFKYLENLYLEKLILQKCNGLKEESYKDLSSQSQLRILDIRHSQLRTPSILLHLSNITNLVIYFSHSDGLNNVSDTHYKVTHEWINSNKDLLKRAKNMLSLSSEDHFEELDTWQEKL